MEPSLDDVVEVCGSAKATRELLELRRELAAYKQAIAEATMTLHSDRAKEWKAGYVGAIGWIKFRTKELVAANA